MHPREVPVGHGMLCDLARPPYAGYIHWAYLVQNDDNSTGGLERQTAVKDRTKKRIRKDPPAMLCFAVKLLSADGIVVGHDGEMAISCHIFGNSHTLACLVSQGGGGNDLIAM